MPIQIDRAAARGLALAFRRRPRAVRNEFSGLDAHQVYRNASRLLARPARPRAHDGTCRAIACAGLRTVIERAVPRGGHILDVGAGDGRRSDSWRPPCRKVLVSIDPT
jgi:hypothetical protein